MMRLSEDKGIVFVAKPADYAGGAVTGESINTKVCTHITYLLQFGAITGDSVLTVKSGASDGVQSTSETFHYRLAGADQAATGADVYAAETAATTLTLTAGTYDNKLLIVEIEVAGLTAGQPFLTLALSAVANPLNVSIVAILSGMRYVANQPQTAIA
jgi:hypothetical protein